LLNRQSLATLLPSLLSLTACQADTTPTDPVDRGAEEIPDEPLNPGDPIDYLARSPTSTFWETTDVLVVGDAVYTCTGVNGLVVHDATDPSEIVPTVEVDIDDLNSQYPRCTHLSQDGDRVFVVSHRDEVEPDPVMALLDVSSPLDPVILDSVQIEDDEVVLDEAVIFQDTAFVAGVSDGIWVMPLGGGDIGARTQLEVDDDLGPVTRMGRVQDDLLAGTSDGRVHRLGTDGVERWSVDLGGAVQALIEGSDGIIVVALGSQGLVRLDPESGAELDRIDTHGTAVRLDTMGNGDLLVANWRDIRVYDFSRDHPLKAVDAVYEAGDLPRHLAAGARGDLIFSGEWQGVHALRYHPDLGGPELTTSEQLVRVAADGEAQTAVVVLTNEGTKTLEISGVTPPEGWSTGTETVSLESGESTELTMTHPGSTEAEHDDLVFETNDPDETETVIEVRLGSSKIFLGDEAPNFSYTGLNTDEVHQLSDQRGKVVMLSYFATF
jgi:hypothetical protein